MHMETIKGDVQCALRRLMELNQTLPANATVFVTSDSKAVLPTIQAVLPQDARVIHNLKHGFIHTTANKHIKKAKMTEPFLDNYLLGKANALGSCWTTYAYAGHFQHSSMWPQHVIAWTHHDEHGQKSSCRVII